MRGKKGTARPWTVYQRKPEHVWSVKYVSPLTGKRAEFRIPKADAWNKLSAEKYAALWYAALVESFSKQPVRPSVPRGANPSLRELSQKWLVFREARINSSNPKKKISQATLFQNKSNFRCHVLNASFADLPLPAVGHGTLRQFLRVPAGSRSRSPIPSPANGPCRYIPCSPQC